MLQSSVLSDVAAVVVDTLILVAKLSSQLQSNHNSLSIISSIANNRIIFIWKSAILKL